MCYDRFVTFDCQQKPIPSFFLCRGYSAIPNEHVVSTVYETLRIVLKKSPAETGKGMVRCDFEAATSLVWPAQPGVDAYRSKNEISALPAVDLFVEDVMCAL